MKLPLFMLVSLGLAATSPAQGPLVPPGTPGPEMKSLQEIWDKAGGLENRTTGAVAMIGRVRSDRRFLPALLSNSASNVSWQITTVDSVGDIEFFTSLAFGPDGRPAIAYNEYSNRDLKFARYNGSVWTSVMVDSIGDTGLFLSLAFGPDGHPAISYYDSTLGDARFSRHDGSVWTATTVGSAGDVGRDTSLAFGPDGQPAMCYQDYATGDLYFARYVVSPGIWLSTIVAFGEVYDESENDTSLAFGPDGQPAIAYYAEPAGDLKFVRFNGSSWSAPVIVKSAGNVGYEPSLSFGPDGQPAISYADFSDGEVEIARYNGSAWTTAIVDSAGPFGGFTSLAFGPDGHPAISFHDATQGDLKFARFDGSAWITETVDSTGNVGYFTSLAFGPDGTPAISYLDSAKSLKFARKGIFPPAP